MKIKYFGEREYYDVISDKVVHQRRCVEFQYRGKEKELFERRIAYIAEEWGIEYDGFKCPVVDSDQFTPDNDIYTVFVDIADRNEFDELSEAWKDAKRVIK